jgi:hypothetical protein
LVLQYRRMGTIYWIYSKSCAWFGREDWIRFSYLYSGGMFSLWSIVLRRDAICCINLCLTGSFGDAVVAIAFEHSMLEIRSFCSGIWNNCAFYYIAVLVPGYSKRSSTAASCQNWDHMHPSASLGQYPPQAAQWWPPSALIGVTGRCVCGSRRESSTSQHAHTFEISISCCNCCFDSNSPGLKSSSMFDCVRRWRCLLMNLNLKFLTIY